jgi:O-antigen ligase
MKERAGLILLPLGVVAILVLLAYVERRPSYFANTTYLGGILSLEVVIACLWRFEKVFFPATMYCFLAAATALPFGSESYTLRWLFLGVGALAGLVIWMKSNRAQHFGLFHLIALFAVLAALASASASGDPKIALLKVGSLFLLFLYASTGGRVALLGREKSFLRALVLACEVLVFLSAAASFVGYDLFGNPNNLGAFIGVVALPVLLWAAVIADGRGERQRAYTALALCGVLLVVSVCRAAIIADVLLIILFTLALHRPSLLVKAAFVAVLLLESMAVLRPAHVTELTDSLTGRFVFKAGAGRTRTTLFGSRGTPWDDTIAAVKQHPWFGTGFGTSDMGEDQPLLGQSMIYTVEGTNREHGSSYLAMVEYSGLLGIVPFLLLIFLAIRAATRVFSWMRRTGSAHHYAVPFAMVVVAGLIHAGFEDWLFASGSYLCVFFWISAFLLVEVSPKAWRERQLSLSQPLPAYLALSNRGQRSA